MRRWRGGIGAATLAVAACAGTGDLARIPFNSPEARPATERALTGWTSSRLETFGDEAAFARYLGDVRAAARARGDWWAQLPSDVRDGEGESIIVTGSAVQPRNASITNVQEAGVDEGDIVKQIDHFLLVLQDARIFVVDTRAGDGTGLALTDRVDVYRDPGSEAWYDEMLVQGDRVVVTGYSYREQASELAVFRLSPEGRLAREGVYQISSDDYYDSGNYSARLVHGNLLIYTPLAIDAVRPGARFPWPAVRRARPAAGPGRARRGGHRLFHARDIHRPLMTSYAPVIHTLSLCPLAPDSAGRALDCRSTAFVGPAPRLFYVSPSDAFLWLAPAYEDWEGRRNNERCGPGRPEMADTLRSIVYRIPLDRGAPGVVAVRGYGFDQFALQARDGEFRAFTGWPSLLCGGDWRDEEPSVPRSDLTFLRVSFASFGRVLREVGAESYTPLPGVPGRRMIDRFTDTHLVYGSLGRARHFRDEDRPGSSQAVAVPVRNPRDARMLIVPHNIIRAEQAGEDVVLTGYFGDDPLSLSLIDLSGEPRLAATHRFDGRYESEGRSHAFNSLIAADGSGLIGLPTVRREGASDRDYWRSSASDLSFLEVGADGRLGALGTLARGIDYDPDDEDGVPGYACEVSCVDWYGNSRPIFTDGRIFALAGAELIEGRLENGRIREVGRLNIALAPRPSQAAR